MRSWIAITFTSLVVLSSASLAIGQSPISVTVTQENSGTTSTFTYQVTNNSDSKLINEITLGLDSNGYVGELRTVPDSVIGPPQSTYTLIRTEESPYYMLDFSVADNQLTLAPGQTATLTATIASADPLYRTGHINVVFNTGETATAPLGPNSKPLADINGDGLVDCLDVRAVRQAFGQICTALTPIGLASDVNRDCTVDVRDLAIITQALPAGMRCQ
jgi:hypothetical protein